MNLLGLKDHSLNQSINYEAVYRRAPATPGLLIRCCYNRKYFNKKMQDKVLQFLHRRCTWEHPILERRTTLFLFTDQQGWTSLNKNPSWSWSFLAPIVLPELELELLGSTIYYQSWIWSFWALNFFTELELELTSSILFFRS